MSSISLNERRFPLVVVTFTRDATDTEFATYLDAISNVYKRRQKFALILDATYGTGASAAQRKLQADWLKQNAMVIRALNVGTAFVVPSAISRGVLTAILWIQPLPCPYALFETTPEALRWGTARLTEAGLSVPPAGMAESGE